MNTSYTKHLFRLLAFMGILLLSVACGSDEPIASVAAPNGGEKPAAGVVIHYSATVGAGNETRATLSNDKKYLFQTGDVLRITGSDISGDLTLTSGAGTASATFEGNLTYEGEGTPADDLELQAVLVSTANKMSPLTYAFAYDPTEAIASTLAEAVEKYSHLTATSKYADKNFNLSQQMSFLNFTVTLADGTTAGTNLTVTINSDGSTVRTGSVKTATVDSKVVAQFVAAMPKGYKLINANFQLGTKSAVYFGGSSKILDANKIYNIKKTVIAFDGSKVTSSDKGKLIGKDCKLYDTVGAATSAGTTAVAMICYVGSQTGSATYNHGLAIALSDASNSAVWLNAEDDCSFTKYTTWADGAATDATKDLNGISNTATLKKETEAEATKAAANYTVELPAGTSGWFLPSAGHWYLFLNGYCGLTWIAQSDTSKWKDSYWCTQGGAGLTTVNSKMPTGTEFSDAYYWSSTEHSAADAVCVTFRDGSGVGAKHYSKTKPGMVRSFLAF